MNGTGPDLGRDPGPVLITGAQGFLGGALVRRLRADGVEVVASDADGGDAPCDLVDFAQVDAVVQQGGFTTILHCGGVSGPMLLRDLPLTIWQINATGTANVLEAARRHDGGRVVVCSTCEVYGDNTGPVDEGTPTRPTGVYAASKLAAEAAMLGYINEHRLDAAALRLAWIYGPGRRTATTLEVMLRAADFGKPTSIDAHPDDPTHYLFIEDAVEAVISAARARAVPGRIYNISAGPSLPMRDILGCILQFRPDARLTLAARRPPERHPSDLDNRRAAAELGFRITVPPAEGLKRYLDALGPSRPG